MYISYISYTGYRLEKYGNEIVRKLGIAHYCFLCSLVRFCEVLS